jgi:hypothetical protein
MKIFFLNLVLLSITNICYSQIDVKINIPQLFFGIYNPSVEYYLTDDLSIVGSTSLINSKFNYFVSEDESGRPYDVKTKGFGLVAQIRYYIWEYGSLTNSLGAYLKHQSENTVRSINNQEIDKFEFTRTGVGISFASKYLTKSNILLESDVGIGTNFHKKFTNLKGDDEPILPQFLSMFIKLSIGYRFG